MSARLRLWLAASMLLFAASASATNDGVLVARYVDPEGFGFRDETPVEPVPGNPATTLGGQRRYVLETALDTFATHIDSEIPIRVGASFEDFGCQEDDQAVLGRGGVTYSATNFEGAKFRNTWYPGSLATHLAGGPVEAGHLEARVRFNIRPDEESDCFSSLPDGYWYGIGQVAPPGQVASPFLRLALHEIGHGLGILSFVDAETGELPGQPPRADVYSRLVYSPILGKAWNRLTDEQRRTTGSDGHPLVWWGLTGNRWAAEVLLPPAEILVDPPLDGQLRFAANLHGKRPFPPLSGLGGELVIAHNAVDESGIDGVEDEPRRSVDACQPLSNAELAAGAIIFAVRGGCHFATKWRHAQQAGSLALIVADRYPAGHEQALERDQFIMIPPYAKIPLWTVSRETGERILASPPQRATLTYDESGPVAGTHDELLALETDWPGSNVSHVARSTVPATFMSAGGGMHQSLHHGQVDMIPGMLHDLGWTTARAKKSQWTGNWYDPGRSGEGCQLTLEGNGWTWILTCYMYRDGEQIWLIDSTARESGWMRFDNLSMTRGTGYGPDFDADEIETIHWGRVDVELINCNSAMFRFVPDHAEFEPMTRQWRKIVTGDCRQPAASHPDRRLSGNFYNPERSGEGIQLAVEADGESVVMTWYSYAGGKQFWAIGTGRHESELDRVVVDALYTTSGGDYGAQFDPDAVQVIPFGSAMLEFDDCNNATLSIGSEDPAFPDIEYGVTRIVSRDCQ